MITPFHSRPEELFLEKKKHFEESLSWYLSLVFQSITQGGMNDTH